MRKALPRATGRTHPHGADAGARVPRRRARAPREVPIAINFAPMIDVTFLLLIFFLVTTTFERAEGLLTSQMPKQTSAPAVSLPLSPIVVRLTQTGPAIEDCTIRVDDFQETPESFDALVALLRRIHKQPGFDVDTPVVIIAEDRVRWDHVVRCWNAAIRAGCQRVAFGEP